MRFVRALSHFLRRASWRPPADWTDADSRALAAFLQTESGARLQRFLCNEICAANERAAMKATPFDCGWACGYRGLYAWFQSLSDIQPRDLQDGAAPDDDDAGPA
jgi:hypothetical protein